MVCSVLCIMHSFLKLGSLSFLVSSVIPGMDAYGGNHVLMAYKKIGLLLLARIPPRMGAKDSCTNGLLGLKENKWWKIELDKGRVQNKRAEEHSQKASCLEVVSVR